MATNQVPDKSIRETEAEIKFQEALARVQAASTRHEAVISILSRVDVSAWEKRAAQAESRKVDKEMREAKRLLREVQALIRKQ